MLADVLQSGSTGIKCQVIRNGWPKTIPCSILPTRLSFIPMGVPNTRPYRISIDSKNKWIGELVWFASTMRWKYLRAKRETNSRTGWAVTSKPIGPSIHIGWPSSNRFRCTRSRVVSNRSRPMTNGISICDSRTVCRESRPSFRPLHRSRR